MTAVLQRSPKVFYLISCRDATYKTYYKERYQYNLTTARPMKNQLQDAKQSARAEN